MLLFVQYWKSLHTKIQTPPLSHVALTYISLVQLPSFTFPPPTLTAHLLLETQLRERNVILNIHFGNKDPNDFIATLNFFWETAATNY